MNAAHGTRAIRTRRLCLVIAVLVTVAAAVLGWSISVSYRDQLLVREKARVQGRLNAIGTNLGAVIGRRHALSSGVAAFVSVNAADPAFERMFELYADGLRANDSVVRAIQLFPRHGRNITYPVAGNEAVLGRTFDDLVRDEGSDVERALNSRFSTMSAPRELRQGGLGMIMRQSVHRGDELWGLAVVVMNVDALLDRAGVQLVGDDLSIVLSDSGGRVFRGDAAVLRDDPVSCHIPLAEGSWTLSGRPAAGWLSDARSQLVAVRCSAFLVALLMGVTTYVIAARQAALALMLKERTRELGASEVKYRHLFEQATATQATADAARVQIAETLERISDGFAMLDWNWRYTYVNPALATLLGLPPSEILGQDIRTLFPAAVGRPIHDAYARAKAEQKLVEIDHYYEPLGRWFRHRLFPSPTGLSVYSKDITETRRAEDALRASEERLRELFQKVPVALRYTDRNGKIVFINDHFTRVFGYTGEDLPAMQNWWTRAYPTSKYRDEVIRRWESAVRAGAREGEVIAGEFCITCKDGTERLVQISGTMMSGGVLAVLSDITERRRAEERARAAQRETATLLAAAEESRAALLSLVEDQKAAQAALRESEERYRALVETSFDCVWEMDTKGRYTYASPRIMELLGFSPEEAVGMIWFDLMPAPEARRVRAILDDLVAKRSPIVALETTNFHRDGRIVVLETNGQPVFSGDGTLVGYRGIDRDITARRNAEKALRLHGAALEAAANAIVITDVRGTIEWANPAFATLSGWTVAESVGKSLRDLVKSGRQDDAFYRSMWSTLTAGNVWRGEIVNRRKDGSLRTEDMTITPLRDEHGNLSHYIAIKQDVTDHKAMEAQFLHAQRMEALGTLAGGIAHDLNNILSPMMMVTGLLKHKLSDEADQELLDMLQSGATRGAGIIRQLLTFSRGQEGDRVVLQPRHLMKEIVAMMRETFPRDIDLRQDIESALWTVLADPTQLHQVLLNLCVNARDAMPSGGCLTLKGANVTLEAGSPVLPPGQASGPYVAMVISDSGQGIAPEIKHRIFDPFFTTKPLGKGTGLGLSTVLGIVRNHQGFLTVDSAEDHGSVFTVYLPASARPADAPVETPSAPPFTPGGAQTVLVVDDERDIRDTTRILLERQNLRALTAGNGEEALAQYIAHRSEVCLVMTDVMMPVMNGVDLIRALRAIDPNLPIVATSGLGEASRGAELAALKVTEVLSKPFDGRTLLALVHRLVSDRK